MEKDITTITPTTNSNGSGNDNGWKIATIIACIVAVCGVGFGVYSMMQSSEKDDQIASLKTQLKEYEDADIEDQNQDQDQEQIIPDGYIAVFHGGVGERTYETYIYKDDNGSDNYGFSYINTTSTTKSYGSSEWDVVITKRGVFDWTDDAFYVAKENNAYSYVTVPNSDETYSIEEFQKMFIMN